MSILIHLLSALALAAMSMAQQDAPTSTNPTSTLSSNTSMPSSSDSFSNDDNNDQEHKNTIGLANYYFVFIGLIVLAAFLAVFLIYKRKQKYGAIMSQSRASALERDLNTWDPVRSRRRYWQGRWRSEDIRREEGLDEHGEPPPPYVPKSRDEEATQQTDGTLPTLPMQTLSREQAGLKPPDYTEVNTEERESVETRPLQHGHGSGSQPL